MDLSSFKFKSNDFQSLFMSSQFFQSVTAEVQGIKSWPLDGKDITGYIYNNIPVIFF